METVYYFISIMGGEQFKSYYVVWKQKQAPYGDRSLPEFKSYYVVWKLGR